MKRPFHYSPLVQMRSRWEPSLAPCDNSTARTNAPRNATRLLVSLFAAICLLLLASCTSRPSDAVQVDQLPNIYPDYTGVTIPAGIAPLNFNLMAYGPTKQEADVEAIYVDVKGSKGGELSTSGQYADFDIDAWDKLTRQNVGGTLTFTVFAKNDGRWMQYRDFTVNISPYPLDDYGLTYRLIAPGYEVYSHIGNYQRDLHTWDEEAIIESQSLPGQCMSCHTNNRTNPKEFTFQLRGKHGATLIQREVTDANGKTEVVREWIKSSHDSILSKCVYPYWHPSGNYCAYSLNRIYQLFWTAKDRLVEVFDDGSDVIVMDVRTKEILRSPLIEHTSGVYETYPAFSVDGKTLYFCSSYAYIVPRYADSVRYSLCSIPFDAENGTFGTRIDTLIDAAAEGHSITLPRPSYDGRWLLYDQADFGNFPINHQEADLWLLNLATGERHPLTEANSDRSESFHNWSSNSRWIVYSSRREDGLYSLLYLTSIDDEGRATKPFLLPQRNPWHYYHGNLYSYNVPDFTCDKVEFDVHSAYQEVFNSELIPVTLR